MSLLAAIGEGEVCEAFVVRTIDEGKKVMGCGMGGLWRGQVGWGVRWGVLKLQEGFETFQ